MEEEKREVRRETRKEEGEAGRQENVMVEEEEGMRKGEGGRGRGEEVELYVWVGRLYCLTWLCEHIMIVEYRCEDNFALFFCCIKREI